MDLGPIRPNLGITPSVKPANRNQNTLDAGTSEAIDRENTRQLQESQKQVDDARRSADAQLDHIRDSYEKQSVEEINRSQTAIESQKNKGYESVRDLQRQQQAELKRVRRDGERELNATKAYYEQSIHQAQSKGSQELDVVRKSQGQQLNHEQKSSDISLKDLQSQNQARLDLAREQGDENFEKFSQQTRAHYEDRVAAAQQAEGQAEEHFQERFKTAVSEQNEIIGDIENRASQQIRDIRQDTALKLGAYASRQRDPFYKLMDLDVKIKDVGESYELTAMIPEYEQKNISVSLKGNQIVLSGHRRNEEKLDITPGHSKGTASFQSFHESFPLPAPVDGKQLMRKFEGDQLTVTVPKKPLVYEAKAAEAPASKKRIEKPDFPENIPHVQREDDTEREVGSGKSSPKSIQGRTLT